MTKTQRSKTQEVGKQAEDSACQYLQQHGLIIMERNFNCKLGEIDIIARDPINANNTVETIVFIEVRQRSHKAFGDGFASVDYRKQQKLIKTAMRFLQVRHLFEKYPCRFDIVSATSPTELSWIKDAFQT